MRPSPAAVFAAPLALALLSAPALAARPLAEASPAPRAALAPAIARLEAQLRRTASARLLPGYPRTQLALARLYRDARRPLEALRNARSAADGFDQQVELHKALSQAQPVYEAARAERAVAHDLGLERDEASLLAGELARGLGRTDEAIRAYALVLESQPDAPIGQDAARALHAIGFLGELPPASPEAPATRPLGQASAHPGGRP